MSTPFSAELKVMAPPMAGQPDCQVPISFVSAYDHRASYRLEFTGAGTKVLDLGTLGPNGAKMFVVTVDSDPSPSAQPVTIAVNASAPGIEVSPGGFLALGSPKPTTAGALTLSITHPTSAKLNVWVFG
jgi:hypothetical protein